MSAHDNTPRASVTRIEPRPRYDYALVPAGEYEARVLDDETRVYFAPRRHPERGAAKLIVWWSIVTMGHVGTVIPAYYALPGVIGRVGRHGRYRAVGHCSRLARDLAAMLGTRPSLLAGPFPRELVTDHLYRVAVVTVTLDRDRVPIPDAARYSRIDRVLGLA
jgi:hypothetical protein